MSDMATGGWQRRPACEAGSLALAAGGAAVVAAILRRPLRVAGALSVVLVALVTADILTAIDPAPLSSRAEGAPEPPATPLPRTASARTGPAPWLAIIKPIEIFSLDAGEFSKSAHLYRARRHPEGGGRQDTIVLGTPGPEPMLRMSLYQRGTEAAPPAPFFSEIARQAAEAGLSVTRSALPDLLPTRFGAFEIARVELSTGSAPATACDGYRLVLDAPALTISGLACGGAAAASRDALRCVLERLDLASGGSDKALADFFAASELKRSMACAGTRLAPDASHAAWLDDRSATPRRIARHR